MAGFTLSCHTRHGVSWVNPSFIDLTEYRMVHRRGFLLVMVYAVSADLPPVCTGCTRSISALRSVCGLTLLLHYIPSVPLGGG